MIIASPPFFWNHFERVDEESFHNFDLKECVFSRLVIVDDTIGVVSSFLIWRVWAFPVRAFFKMEVNAAGVCPVVQPEVEKQKQLAH